MSQILAKKTQDTQIKERFFNRIWKNPFSGCWEWVAESSKGYGIFSYKGKDWRAHRFSFHYFKDILLEGYEIDHVCCNPHCVNPDHLDQVTKEEHWYRTMHRRKINYQDELHNQTIDKILNTTFTKEGVIIADTEEG